MRYFEISEEQGTAAADATRVVLPSASMQVHKDLDGQDRVLELQLGAITSHHNRGVSLTYHLVAADLDGTLRPEGKDFTPEYARQF